MLIATLFALASTLAKPTHFFIKSFDLNEESRKEFTVFLIKRSFMNVGFFLLLFISILLTTSLNFTLYGIALHIVTLLVFVPLEISSINKLGKEFQIFNSLKND